MKKIKFNVVPKKVSILDLLKEINAISCRISIDFENKIVIVENVNNDAIETVITIVDKYYVITGVDIDNIVADTTTSTNVNPTSSNNLVEFKEHPDLLEKLGKTLNWALCTMNVPEQFIANVVYGWMNELSMNYSSNPIVDCKKGDVVECSFGSHLTGEINGMHMHCIVCNVNNEKVVVAPITKHTGEYVNSTSFIEFTPKVDVIYDKFLSTGGSVLLDKAREISAKRVNKVIGKTSAGFMKKVLNKLHDTFNFVK